MVSPVLIRFFWDQKDSKTGAFELLCLIMSTLRSAIKIHLQSIFTSFAFSSFWEKIVNYSFLFEFHLLYRCKMFRFEKEKHSALEHIAYAKCSKAEFFFLFKLKSQKFAPVSVQGKVFKNYFQKFWLTSYESPGGSREKSSRASDTLTWVSLYQN